MLVYANAGIKGDLGAKDQFYYMGGVALYFLKQFNQADEYLKKSLTLNAKLAGAYYYRGLALEASIKPEEAQKLKGQSEALEFDPEEPFPSVEDIRLKIF